VTIVVNSNAESLQWQNYLDVTNDVLPFLQMSTVTEAVAMKLQLFTDMACQWVQNYLGRPIAPTAFDRRYDGFSGWNGAYIDLPYYPVLEIISVTEYWGVAGPHVLNESIPTNQVDGFQCDYLRGIVIRVFPGNVQKPWFPGSRSIEIQWKAGYNPVPADIKIATLSLVAHWWHKTQQASRAAVRAGGDDMTVPGVGMFGGVSVDTIDLLEPYVQVGLG
jgi:hypothetical protein